MPNRTHCSRRRERVAQLQARLAALVPNGRPPTRPRAARIGDAVQILAAITNALPDDTVLTDLTFREPRVTITGSVGAGGRN